MGSTTVVCTATDLAGNTANRNFTVTVEEDDVTTPGRMDGNGFIRSGGDRYDFHFSVRENQRGEAANFRLDVDDSRRHGKDDSFVATSVTSVAFSDDPTYHPGRRQRPQVDTVLFTGTGKWNGAAGYTYEVYAEDRGEPGRHRESVRITIKKGNTIVVSVDDELSGGNVQSHRIKH
jgi:hypothetical protein